MFVKRLVKTAALVGVGLNFSIANAALTTETSKTVISCDIYVLAAFQGQQPFFVQDRLTLDENEISPSANSGKFKTIGELTFGVNPKSVSYSEGKRSSVAVNLTANIAGKTASSALGILSRESHYLRLAWNPNVTISNDKTIKFVMMSCFY